MKKTSAAIVIAGAFVSALMLLAGYREVSLPLKYPADATNYIWQLQQSSDMKHWTVIRSNLQGAPSGFIAITNVNTKAYFRAVTQNGWL